MQTLSTVTLNHVTMLGTVEMMYCLRIIPPNAEHTGLTSVFVI
jgi:hypothetical protein